MQYTTYDTSVTGYVKTFDAEKDKYYYSQGFVALYNGDGYTTYSCSKTPNYIIKSNSRAIDELVVQQIDVSPDLILAIGTNGKTGYVKSADLNMSNITTPDQAVAFASYVEAQMAAQSQSPPTIPLYESDGVTVIGEFELSYPDEIISE